MRRSKYVYVAGGWAFVPHPHVRAWWLRLDLSVLKVVCPQCNAPIGLPCASPDGDLQLAEVHYNRKRAGAGRPIMLQTTGLQLLVEELE